MAGPLDRLLRDDNIRATHDCLVDDLSATDLRSLLLEVARVRADERSPARVLAQYQSDRFCAAVDVDAVGIAHAQAVALAAVADRFEPVQLSPVSPLGASSSLASVPQHNVVTTMRLTEVLSDPTNVLALEASLARRQNSTETVRLAAVHRVLRAQRFTGPRSFAHFSLLGMVSAGKDRGDRAFEVAELGRHLRAMIGAVHAIDGHSDIVVHVSDHSGRYDEAERLVASLYDLADPSDRGDGRFEVSLDRERTHGTGYYPHLCCKVGLRRGAEIVEVGDAGTTNWSQQLLANRKERLVISGIGLDRIVM